jgi:uncharacterized protein (TIGR00255 family)
MHRTGAQFMSISSMTGFGRAAGSSGPWTFQWEARCVNGKGLDVRMRLPPGIEAIEQLVRAAAAKHLRRGNVQVSLQLTREESAALVRVNQQALDAAIKAANAVAAASGGSPASTDALMGVRGVLEITSEEADDETVAERDAALVECATRAFAALAEDRSAEGARLAETLAGQLDRIAALVEEATKNPSRTPEAIRARLADQVARIMDAGPSLDPDRLHQEAVMVAAKADIQEELDRLRAHVESARELLQTREPVGRKLDFLAQEFNREANTLCSKSADTSLTRTGLELKTVIDQLKEQVQNIE